MSIPIIMLDRAQPNPTRRERRQRRRRRTRQRQPRHHPATGPQWQSETRPPVLRCGFRDGQSGTRRSGRRFRVRSVPAPGHEQSALPVLVQFHRRQCETGPALHIQHRQHQQGAQLVSRRTNAAGEIVRSAQVAATAPAACVLPSIAGASESLCAQFRVRLRKGGRGVSVCRRAAVQFLATASVFGRAGAAICWDVCAQ